MGHILCIGNGHEILSHMNRLSSYSKFKTQTTWNKYKQYRWKTNKAIHREYTSALHNKWIHRILFWGQPHLANYTTASHFCCRKGETTVERSFRETMLKNSGNRFSTCLFCFGPVLGHLEFYIATEIYPCSDFTSAQSPESTQHHEQFH